MKLYYRIHQFILRCGAYFVKWRSPIIIKNDNLYSNLQEKLIKFKSILIITDKHLIKIGLLDDLVIALDSINVDCVIYDGIQPNPTIANVEDARKLYLKNNCEAIISFGGGSSIDCGKAVSARIVRPKCSVQKMRGLLKVRKRTVPLIAIPTTAGTGSETTIASVITNDVTHEKYVISDLCIVPKFAVLNAEFTTKLPPHLTGSTGMDALTHGIESYLGKSNTKKTKHDALKSIKLIYENLQQAYDHGDDLKARNNMLYASFYAGRAFTRAYVGNIHAIAHSLGGLYDMPHGLANAVVLPVVLRAYGKSCEKKLGQISDYIGLSHIDCSNSEKSDILITWIENLNEYMNIPNKIAAIKDEDILIMAEHAQKEANPFYPVPVIWNTKQFSEIYISLKV